jgi:hypothetical protein
MLRRFRTPSLRLGIRGLAGALALASAGICAAATFVSAQVAAKASSDPSQGDATTVGAGHQPTAGPDFAAGSSGVWDPTLNRFRDPTGEELAGMSQRSLVAQAERPQIELRSDGSMVLRVSEEGFGATWGHLRPEGTAEMRCAHSGSVAEAPGNHPTATKEEK